MNWRASSFFFSFLLFLSANLRRGYAVLFLGTILDLSVAAGAPGGWFRPDSDFV